MQKNILLTGSNGFIGSHFKNYYKYKYNIKTFSFLNNNFNDLTLNGIDTVVHLSALVHQMGGSAKKEYYEINVLQTINLAKKAKESGVEHFIFMSTIAVYGIEIGIIKKDSDCNPITNYGKSKLKAEQELLKLKDNNFKITIIRPPIVYGYKAPGNMKSLISLIKNISVLPFANIQNRRSMVYIGNLCHLINEIIAQKQEGIFLASDDEVISITKLIKLIAKELNKKIYLIEIPFFRLFLKKIKPNIYKRLYESLEVDNSLTKQILSLENPYTLEEGIRYMIKGE